MSLTWLAVWLAWFANDPLAGLKFYVEPNSHAAQQAQLWRNSRPQDAALMDILASTPICSWFGDWNKTADGTSTVMRDIDNYVTAAVSQGATPCAVIYNVPFRDCGGYSANGPLKDSDYRAWMNQVSQGIGPRKVIVIYEPDAVAGWDCLTDPVQLQGRKDNLRYGITLLKSATASIVWTDGAHDNWHAAEDMASRLMEIGAEQADGIAINVSNYRPLAKLLPYAEALSSLLGKPYLIDNSRNGLGQLPDAQIYDPSWAAWGGPPTVFTGLFFPHWAANYNIKRIGEPDKGGYCGTDSSGAAISWCPELALQIMKNWQAMQPAH